VKILGIIPARGGSKGVIGKNIKPLAGKALILYSVEAALASKLNKVIVSTDDPAIAAVAKEAGAEVPFMRPQNLASDTSKSLDVATHALLTMEELDSCTYDAIMLLQPTAPFRNTADIDEAINLLLSNPSADSVISVVDVEAHHPARMKYIEEGRLIDPPFCEEYENQNRQELKPMYIRNGAIYLTRRGTLLANSYKGKYCMALVMPQNRSVNIDTRQDFEYAEWIFEKNRHEDSAPGIR
jgi:CMP-N-acetylneuraminic acid synthetase